MFCPITYIYGLRDPLSGTIKYIGKSDCPTRRLAAHLGSFDQKKETHKTRWIRGLVRKGRVPELVCLEAVSVEQWPKAESRWIDAFRDQGRSLTNSTDGGRGGGNPCSDTRAKLAKARSAWWDSLSSEERTAFTEGRATKLIGKRHSAERVEKVRAKLKGRELSKSQREKLSAVHKERWNRMSAEQRQEATKNLGHGWSLASRQKLSASTKGRKLRRCSSSFIGVAYFKRDRKWRAYLRDASGKQVHLGYFATEEEAARAYDAAILPLAGEFARLNFPAELRSMERGG